MLSIQGYQLLTLNELFLATRPRILALLRRLLVMRLEYGRFLLAVQFSKDIAVFLLKLATYLLEMRRVSRFPVLWVILARHHPLLVWLQEHGLVLQDV